MNAVADLFADDPVWPAYLTAQREVAALEGDDDLGGRRDDVLSLLSAEGGLHPHNAEAHVTVTAVVVDDHRRVLLARHPVFGAWQPPGGHVEEHDGSLIAAALREAREESGVGEVIPVGAIDVEVYPASCPRNGAAHYDVRFLFRSPGHGGDPTSPEGIEVAWFAASRLDGAVAPDVGRTIARCVAALGRP